MIKYNVLDMTCFRLAQVYWELRESSSRKVCGGELKEARLIKVETARSVLLTQGRATRANTIGTISNPGESMTFDESSFV